jgi:hypothetical protein
MAVYSWSATLTLSARRHKDMTTQEFIAKTYGTTNDKWGRYGYERWCSSVKTDRDGNGYSNTTSKHINWARQARPNAIEVELRGAPLPLTLDDIEAKLGAKVVDLQTQMDAKKRKDTQVYKSLAYEFNKTLMDYNNVKEANREN